MAKTFTVIGIPVYLGRIEDSGVLFSLVNAVKPGSDNQFRLASSNTSANCGGMNTLWIEALEAKDRGEATHFLMLHSDIVPEVEFLDKMHEVMARVGCDILSAVVPIKDEKGLTSTALEREESIFKGDDPEWSPRRLTIRELHKMEPTFTAPNILLNDGLMLVDLRKDWVEKIWFHFDDVIIKRGDKRHIRFKPEDWNFSRDARKLGASMYATREVKLTHHGQQSFPNSFVWGEWDTDAIHHCPGVPGGVLDRMDAIEGWFMLDEGAFLYKVAEGAFKMSDHVMEIGSYKGRSTSVLGEAAKRAGKQKRVFAVDPHEGNCGPEDRFQPTFDVFRDNMVKCGVSDHIVALKVKSQDVHITEQLGLLFIDGLHDYDNVKFDLEKFYGHVKPEGFIAFHDYEPQYPGVVKLVDEEIASGRLIKFQRAKNLMVCRKPK